MSTVVAPLDTAVVISPYKFLDYFTYSEDDEASFAGRDDEAAEVAARLAVDRTVILYGASGLGKTSLVLAGIFPLLKARGFEPVHVRLLDDPQEQVQKKLAEAIEAIRSAPGAKDVRPSVVLALDQFEELFVRYGKQPEVQDRLAAFLADEMKNPFIDLRILISLREDFLPQLDEFRHTVPGWFVSQYRLRPLTAFGARQAICRPLTRAGYTYEPAIVGGLLDLLAAESYDSLLLQIACDRLLQVANEKDRPKELREADLRAIGDLNTILGTFLTNVYSKFESAQLLLARNVLDALVTSDGTKRTVTAEQLAEMDFAASLSEVQSVLQFLQDNRLVRLEQHGQQNWYELSHERLVKPLLDWFSIDAEFSNFRYLRDQIRTGSQQGKFRSAKEFLLSEEALRKMDMGIRQRLRLKLDGMAFMLWSATVRRVDEDIRYWADQLQHPQSSAELLLMTYRDMQLQQSALLAVPMLKSCSSALLDRCLELALTAPDEPTRDAASAALSSAGDISMQMEAARTALKGERRGKALAIFATLQAAGKCYPSLKFRDGLAVASCVRSRKLGTDSAFRTLRSAMASKLSLLAGLVWTLIFGASFVPTLPWAIKPDFSDGTTGLADGMAVYAILVTPFILGAAWGFGRCSVKAYEKRKLFGHWTPFVALPVLSFSVLVFVLGLIPAQTSPALHALINAVILTVLAISSVLWIERVAASYMRLKRSIPFILFTALLIPLGVLLAAAHLPLRSVIREELVGFFFVDFGLWSFAIVIACMPARIVFGRLPAGAPASLAPRVAWLLNTACGAALVMLGAETMRALEWRCIPFPAQSVAFSEQGFSFAGTAGSPSHLWPVVAYGKVLNPGQPTYQIVREVQGPVLSDYRNQMNQGSYIYLPHGSFRLRAQETPVYGGPAPLQRVPYHLTTEPIETDVSIVPLWLTKVANGYAARLPVPNIPLNHNSTKWEVSVLVAGVSLGSYYNDLAATGDCVKLDPQKSTLELCDEVLPARAVSIPHNRQAWSNRVQVLSPQSAATDPLLTLHMALPQAAPVKTSRIEKFWSLFSPQEPPPESIPVLLRVRRIS